MPAWTGAFVNAFTAQWQAYRAHGLKKMLYQMLIMDYARAGTLVGKDVFGNEYYQDKQDMNNRDRWVMYSKWNYDASQIPAEWHAWMHHSIDEPPTQVLPPSPIFQEPFKENLTGTRSAFKTYSTTTHKIHPWQPSVKARQADGASTSV
ncbi:hypothetical protein SeMB42_g07781 [Synchytrium endobioticum]|uniref:NADH dehydrogenase [ubiquinone] 1 alpha subcomplex subunit n=1 Tax=Synchytrium endobioticum TaxID=286115 RepID=A0A507CF89_9FUNG|nr:hypothetical protein SeMB42_g07781 [Synchytrium endobioticum]TPX37829.1 hypothetical protein SeLEV6574_g07853 [Synchytrium endobioticum]